MVKKLDPEDLRDVQVAVDDLMPRQHYEAIEYLLAKIGITLPLIRLNPDQKIYDVKRAIVCSNPTYIPDSLDEFSYAECSVLNLKTLQEYRNLLVDGISNLHGRKIYIARQNFASRRLVNEAAVIEVFIKLGFEVVYPENYSFTEQVNLFHSAKYIAGPTGAAFSNLIFCQKGTIVINLLAEAIDDFSIFSNLCTLSGSEYFLMTGKLLKKRSEFNSKINWLFSEFEIDVDDLDTKLKTLL